MIVLDDILIWGNALIKSTEAIIFALLAFVFGMLGVAIFMVRTRNSGAKRLVSNSTGIFIAVLAGVFIVGAYQNIKAQALMDLVRSKQDMP